MADEMIARGLKALIDPQRLHVVEFLSQCCYGVAAVHANGGVEGPIAGEICCHITGDPNISLSISNDLHLLEEAGIIRMTQRGTAMVCTIRSDSLIAISNYVAGLAKGNHEKPYCCKEYDQL